MSKAIYQSDFQLPRQTKFYRGKVRDVYTIDEDQLVMVVSDRISAFDHILPEPIPFKGQVLTQLAAYFLNATSDIVPNWLDATPDANVMVGMACKPIMLEMVIRGYLAGHSWREYRAGRRTICGETMPDGMKEADKFPTPMITPATKAVEGHDEDISKADILNQEIVSPEVYAQLEKYTHDLFQRGTEMAASQGLILVDTKYEFGIYNGEIYVIDEIHTPDSSRYYITDGYVDRQTKGEPQKQLSKEFVREWLMDQGFQGLDGQTMPDMPQSFVDTVSNRYIELYEKVSGKPFVKANDSNPLERIEKNINTYLEE